MNQNNYVNAHLWLYSSAEAAVELDATLEPQAPTGLGEYSHRPELIELQNEQYAIDLANEPHISTMLAAEVDKSRTALQQLSKGMGDKENDINDLKNKLKQRDDELAKMHFGAIMAEHNYFWFIASVFHSVA